MSKLRNVVRQTLAEELEDFRYRPHSGWVDGTSALGAMGYFEKNNPTTDSYLDPFKDRNMPIGHTVHGWIVRWNDAYELIRDAKGTEAARRFLEKQLEIANPNESKFTRANSPQLVGIELSEKEVDDANYAFRGKYSVSVESGRYLPVMDYLNFDILTRFDLTSGERVYFASKNHPFGDVYGSYSAATKRSRDLTGFGTDFSDDYPQFVEAEKIYSDHKRWINS